MDTIPERDGRTSDRIHLAITLRAVRTRCKIPSSACATNYNSSQFCSMLVRDLHVKVWILFLTLDRQSSHSMSRAHSSSDGCGCITSGAVISRSQRQQRVTRWIAAWQAVSSRNASSQFTGTGIRITHTHTDTATWNLSHAARHTHKHTVTRTGKLESRCIFASLQQATTCTSTWRQSYLNQTHRANSL